MTPFEEFGQTPALAIMQRLCRFESVQMNDNFEPKWLRNNKYDTRAIYVLRWAVAIFDGNQSGRRLTDIRISIIFGFRCHPSFSDTRSLLHIFNAVRDNSVICTQMLAANFVHAAPQYKESNQPIDSAKTIAVTRFSRIRFDIDLKKLCSRLHLTIVTTIHKFEIRYISKSALTVVTLHNYLYFKVTVTNC